MLNVKYDNNVDEEINEIKSLQTSNLKDDAHDQRTSIVCLKRYSCILFRNMNATNYTMSTCY